jgi:periplasmic mercuric ion binding protein
MTTCFGQKLKLSIFVHKITTMTSARTLFLFFTLSWTLFSCGSGSFKEEAFYVRGNCGMCKERIEVGVQELNGVQSAVYNVNKQALNVIYDTTKVDRITIESKCADLGHSTETVHMNEKHHDELPECCQESQKEGKH